MSQRRYVVSQNLIAANIDRIAAVSETDIPSADEGILDLGGRTVIPGLINCHTHLCLDGSPDPNAALEDRSLTENALVAGRHAKATVKAGVTTVSCNIECFDESLRPEILPAKGRIPIITYEKTWEKCLDIFGKNEVFTVVVVGIGEGDESILGGVEMAASHGVMTYLVPHSPAIGAVYKDMEAPDADRMLSLYAQAAAIYKKYRLDICACRAGCVRGSGFSAIKDVARFEA